MGTVVPDSNEAMRCEFISAILHSAVLYVKEIITKKNITLDLQFEVVVVIRFAQNLTQCESAYQTNKKKRKVSEAFETDYLYNIIITEEPDITDPIIVKQVVSAVGKGAYRSIKKILEYIVPVYIQKERLDPTMPTIYLQISDD
ncbi:hypothetical protein C1645_837611 [Glomus cerebriforme]|uniref:Uncharacterized protein n=1 Tax=Glomus cerebriforme TaxID=658196 RepID=A0A397S8A9_9GLOM|nr:hypothetical protein C1645_837611 [Glomus cerebriforme]